MHCVTNLADAKQLRVRLSTEIWSYNWLVESVFTPISLLFICKGSISIYESRWTGTRNLKYFTGKK